MIILHNSTSIHNSPVYNVNRTYMYVCSRCIRSYIWSISVKFIIIYGWLHSQVFTDSPARSSIWIDQYISMTKRKKLYAFLISPPTFWFPVPFVLTKEIHPHSGSVLSSLSLLNHLVLNWRAQAKTLPAGNVHPILYLYNLLPEDT